MVLGSLRNLQELGSLWWILGGLFMLLEGPHCHQHLTGPTEGVSAVAPIPLFLPVEGFKGKAQIFCIFPICSQDVVRAEAAPQRLQMSLVGLVTLQVALGDREVLGTLSWCAGTQIPAGCPQVWLWGCP